MEITGEIGILAGDEVGERLRIEYIDLGVVALWENNHKLHDIGGVINSIEKYGYKDPAKYEPKLNGGRGGIVEGNGRSEALAIMREEGYGRPRGILEDSEGRWYVPVLFGVDAESEAVAEAYGIDHNSLTLGGGDASLGMHMGMYDGEFLDQLVEMHRMGVGPISYDGEDVQRMINMVKEEEKGEGEGEPVPEPKFELGEALVEKWEVEFGQLWRVGDHWLMCGDSRNEVDVALLFEERTAACMWTDPPYGVDYTGRTKDKLKIDGDDEFDLPDLLKRSFGLADKYLAEGAPIYVCHPAGKLSIEFSAAFINAGWHFHETLVWVKDSMVLGHSDYHYQHEPILYGWKMGKARNWYAGRDRVSVFEVPRPKRSTEHPTMKPVELVEMQLSNSTIMRDWVYDPFLGAGSTAIACERLGRCCLGMDKDPIYFAVTLERLSEMGLEAEMVDQI